MSDKLLISRRQIHLICPVILVSILSLALEVGGFVVESPTNVRWFAAPSAATHDQSSRKLKYLGSRRLLVVTSASPSSSSPRSATPISHRQDQVTSLVDWAKTLASIQIYNDGVDLAETDNAGLGFVATKDITSGQILVQVPADVALTVEIPGDGPNDNGNLRRLCRDSNSLVLKTLPWFVQFSLYLHALMETTDGTKAKPQLDRSPWLASLPSSFDTPIHWTENQRKEWLQYDAMVQSVARQEKNWKSLFDQISVSGVFPSLSWEQFVWGCETARSRAFSGSTAGRFNPGIYAFTLLLVAVYIGFGLGTLEQAANGAGVVFSATVLKDFVLPKLFKKKQYVICPIVDMANHNSVTFAAQVSLEYFANAYSLVTSQSVRKGQPVDISYGSRSNDQLLQYYGFVEQNNPSDVYIMPPLREWPLQAMEEATGRQVSSGRLQKLNRAGLLGSSGQQESDDATTEDSMDDGGGGGDLYNPLGGVVVNRVDGIDPAVVQALRALFSTDQEWDAAGQAVGNFASSVSSGNDRAVLLAAKTALECELKSKPTTLQQDLDLLKQIETELRENKSTRTNQEILAIRFRAEKKRLLIETVEKLRV
ncbi:hypothetical protein ACA910_016786 [Epithemia clementina (nom. ined.)]